MSTRRRQLRLVIVAIALALGCLTWPPAFAATDTPDLAVRINSLSPLQLSDKSDITMTGTVTNRNSYTWKNTQAYLVISQAPYTSRSQLDEAIGNSLAYTGRRVVDLKSIAIMGDIAPGASVPFTIKVRSNQLVLNGSNGVYPVGVQILGTDPAGLRSNRAIARATTFLPKMTKTSASKVATSIGWPFIMPARRNADRTLIDPDALMSSVSAGGQLNNLLGLAESIGAAYSTAIIDPALLVGVDDLAHRRNLPKKTQLTDAQVSNAKSFLARLLKLARTGSSWALGYDRPDVLALQQNDDVSGALKGAVERSTRATLDNYRIVGRHVTWPTRHGVTNKLLQYVRGPGDDPAIVDSDDVEGWSNRNGSLVQYSTPDGPMPILVDDALTDGVPGSTSTVALRQRLVSDAVLAIMSQAIDPESRANTIAVLPPNWNPGLDWASGNLGTAFTSPWVEGINFDELLTRPIGTLPGSLPSTASVAPVNRSQLSAATEITRQSTLLRSVYSGDDQTSRDFDQDVAEAVSLQWRSHRKTGLAITRDTAARAVKELSKIRIEGPKSVTLSGSNGKFPLTISNDTKHSIRVGVRMDSSNPALTIPDLKTTLIESGESHTLTVKVDVRDQGSTSVAAQLITPSGKAVGTPVVFNVRSSAVGTVLWVAIGGACLFVVIAMLRRFTRRHRNGRAT